MEVRTVLTGEHRRSHNLYSTPNYISERIRWAGHVARIDTMRYRPTRYNILTQRPEERRLLGRRKYRWEDIKMDIKEEGVGWM